MSLKKKSHFSCVLVLLQASFRCVIRFLRTHCVSGCGLASCSLHTLASNPQTVPSFPRADGADSRGRCSKQDLACVQGSSHSPVLAGGWQQIREAHQRGCTRWLLPLQLLLWHFTLSVRSEAPNSFTPAKAWFSYRTHAYWFQLP